MDSFHIDINCDVGEGIGNEASLLPLINSCNIACGGHAGDEHTMREVIRLAKQHQVKIGAHPSYPDKENFGRKIMSISHQELKQSIKNQLDNFMQGLVKENAELHHIKAHGALYNQTAKDEDLAKTYLEAITEYKSKAAIYVPFGSIVAGIAMEKGFQVIYEAFGDRNYNSNLSLVSRQSQNALIQEPDRVLYHILPMIKEGNVRSVSGEYKEIEAQTLCIHGDTPSALQILTYLSQELPNHRVQLK